MSSICAIEETNPFELMPNSRPQLLIPADNKSSSDENKSKSSSNGGVNKPGARTLIPQSQVKPFDIRPEKLALFKRSNPTTFATKDFHAWLNWWQTNFTTEDYFKYISTQV